MSINQAYDITNPLVHRRVIFDGITNSSPIGVDPGETRKGVVLADHVAKKLLAQDDDLKLVPAVPSSDVNLSPPPAEVGVETTQRPKLQLPQQPARR